ncbi:MAG: LysR family transcriptional regulator [Eubacteriales bacterium]|nr:LysR family transcriptional regulator [Eubacteriales bacterium]
MDQQLRYTLVLKVYGEDKIFGPGIAELLEKIDCVHSIRKATLEMGMAYSKAWSIIKTAETSLGFPLLSSTTGGAGGGGAVLTDRGRQFLLSYRKFETIVHDFADEIFMEMFGAQA